MSSVRSITTHSMEKGSEKRVGEYVIERGIPFPERPSAILDALKALEVGESFVHRKRVNTYAIKKAGPGKRFAQRSVGKGPQHRIWRMK